MLLGSFSRARSGTGHWGDEWTAALGENAKEALRRFVDTGLLAPCPVQEALSFAFSSAQLQQMLRERGLKVSGRKDELSERLYRADSAAMEEAVAKMNLLKCSESGQQLASEFLVRRDEMQRTALAALRERNPGLACQVVCEFQDALGFPEVPMFRTRPDLADVSNVFSVSPRILAGVNTEALEHLRVAGGMAFLGLRGHRLPESLETGIRLAGPAAVNMIIAAVQIGRNVESWRRLGLVRTVKILCSADGPCAACAGLRSRIWPINELPEIPYEHCTSPQGCRCVVCAADLIEG